MINKKILNYRIVRQIGKGGFSSVWEAINEKLGLRVAIKILDAQLSTDNNMRSRFENEARVMASLNHPSIIRVIDYIEENGTLFIVLEYLEGTDLGSLIKKNGAYSSLQAKNILMKILEAFQYAHAKNIVHRDVKPSNIFILPDNSIKVLDFGIAKILGQNTELTHTGTQMGTPVYMSPEQVDADKTFDHRSDIYSLGVLYWFMLSGRHAYNTDELSSFKIFTKICNDPLPEIPGKLAENAIIAKATSKFRQNRFQSCSEFGMALISENLTNTQINSNIKLQEAYTEANKQQSKPQKKELGTKNNPIRTSTETSNKNNGILGIKKSKILIISVILIGITIIVFTLLLKSKTTQEKGFMVKIYDGNPGKADNEVLFTFSELKDDDEATGKINTYLNETDIKTNRYAVKYEIIAGEEVARDTTIIENPVEQKNAKYVIKAMAGGKPVASEKPIYATDEKQAIRLAEDKSKRYARQPYLGEIVVSEIATNTEIQKFQYGYDKAKEDKIKKEEAERKKKVKEEVELKKREENKTVDIYKAHDDSIRKGMIKKKK